MCRAEAVRAQITWEWRGRHLGGDWKACTAAGWGGSRHAELGAEDRETPGRAREEAVATDADPSRDLSVSAGPPLLLPPQTAPVPLMQGWLWALPAHPVPDLLDHQ